MSELRGVDEVDETLELTAELPMEEGYREMYTRPDERPTIPLHYHRLQVENLLDFLSRATKR